MNKEIKAGWIERLLSGKFPQAKGRLSVNGGYCCLGVLCEMAAESGIVTKEYVTLLDERTVARYGDSTGWLPKEVYDWAEINNASLDDPYVKNTFDNGHLAQLSRLNDGGMPFNQISTLIEESL